MGHVIITIPVPADPVEAAMQEARARALGLKPAGYWPEHLPEKYNRMSGGWMTEAEEFGT